MGVWLLLAAWLAQGALATAGVALYARNLGWPQPWPAARPRLLVLAPVRGPLPGLGRFLDALAAQDYPDWRVVFAVESAADPAIPALQRFAAADPARRSVVVAGPAAGRAQKLHNLLAALAEAGPEDAVLVTVDADMVPPPDFLAQLTRPVLAGQAPIASGYRWPIPEAGGFAASLLALADIAIATLPRHARVNLCWGGATAISAEAARALDLPRVWARTVSDDLSLSRAARQAGMVIYAPLTVRPPSPASGGLRAVLGFGARQYRLLRLHAPGTWWLAGLLLALPVAGATAALAGVLAGRAEAFLALGLVLGLQGWRARLRAGIARRLLPPEAAAASARLLLRGWWRQPAASLLHLLAWAGSAGPRRIAWAGRRYGLAPDGTVRSVTPLGAR